MKKYRWGFCGSGGISNRAAQDIASLQQAEIYAIASRSQISARAFALKHGAQCAYDDFEKMCLDPNLDIIYIGTPHIYHKEQVIMALARGKAVLCEKPMSVSAADTKEMVQAAEKHSSFLMEALWTRFLPVIQQVKKWIDEGEIGEVFSIQAGFCSQAKFDPVSRIFSKQLGGGALLDLGVYPISISCFLVSGNVKEINAKGKVGPTNVDETSEVCLKFDDQSEAHISCSIVASSSEAMTILGSKGRIEVPFFWRATEAFLFCEGRKKYETYGQESFAFEAAEVMRMLDAGKCQSPIMPWHESIQIAEIIDESLRQVYSKK